MRWIRGAPYKPLVVVWTLCATVAIENDARATLGGDVPSVKANEQALAAVHTVQALSPGERHDLALPSGVVVREYVSPAGVVYAVTWRGPRVPDLKEILGAHFADLEKRTPSGGHNRMTLSLDDFEVRAWGHQRSFAGRAWIPSLVPAGVNLDAVLE